LVFASELITAELNDQSTFANGGYTVTPLIKSSVRL
jgi:hypothetical protein